PTYPVRIIRVGRVLQAFAEEQPPKGFSPGIPFDIGVQARQQCRPPTRTWISRPEPSCLVLAKYVVATEHFVRTLARQYDLGPTVTYQAGQRQQRRRSSAHQRPFRKPDHICECLSDLSITHLDLPVIC